MASADEYAAWIVKNADKKGTPEFETVASAYKLAKADTSSTQPAQESGLIDNAVSAVKDIPRQVGLTARYGLEGLGNMADLASSPIRGAMNLALPKTMQIQPGSGSNLADMIGLPKPQGKLEEDVGTITRSMAMGAVPVAGANAVSGLVSGSAKNIATALGSNAGNQIASAGVSGAIDATTKDSGLSEPSRAALSMAGGMAVPLATNALAAGRRTVTGPGVSESTNNAVNAARDAGYVVPPTQGNPSLANRAIEGFSGKLTTAQNASAKNQSVTDNLAKQAIGLPADQAITPASLKAVRDEAGKAYEAIGSLPVRPATTGSTIENRAATPELDPKKALFDLRQARNDATGWYENYKRTASPDALKQANQSRADANRLEKELEEYAKSIGRDDLIPALVEARQLIAKTYSVEKALNPATGTIDAAKLANELKKGKPLSDQLRQIGEFAQSFPKAVQTPERMGSLPGVSPLDFGTASAVSGVTANPMYMAGVLARPIARKLALSDTVQNRLRNAALTNATQSPRNALMISPVLGMPSQNDEQR